MIWTIQNVFRPMEEQRNILGGTRQNSTIQKVKRKWKWFWTFVWGWKKLKIPSKITPPFLTKSSSNRLPRKYRRQFTKWISIAIIISPCQIFKVQILWEGHTIWKTISHLFLKLLSNIKTDWLIFSNFWGLLKISDLYQEDFFIVNCKH